MAWLEQDRAGAPFQLVFRLGEQRIKRSTRTKDEHEAQEIALRVERRLRMVEQAGEDPLGTSMTAGWNNSRLRFRSRIRLNDSLKTPNTRRVAAHLNISFHSS